MGISSHILRFVNDPSQAFQVAVLIANAGLEKSSRQ